MEFSDEGVSINDEVGFNDIVGINEVLGDDEVGFNDVVGINEVIGGLSTIPSSSCDRARTAVEREVIPTMMSERETRKCNAMAACMQNWVPADLHTSFATKLRSQRKGEPRGSHPT